MAFAILKPDGSLHRVVLSALPEGQTHSSLGVAEVNEDVPSGFHRTGWQIVDGVCVGVFEAVIQPDPDPVPESVSLKQFRKALRRRGVPPESVVAWINANVTDPIEKAEAIEDIEYSNVVERSNPFLNAMAAALGKDPTWVDDTMRLAATLQ